MQPKARKCQPFERGQFHAKAKTPGRGIGDAGRDIKAAIGIGPVLLDHHNRAKGTAAAQAGGGVVQFFGREFAARRQARNVADTVRAHTAFAAFFGQQQLAKMQARSGIKLDVGGQGRGRVIGNNGLL